MTRIFSTLLVKSKGFVFLFLGSVVTTYAQPFDVIWERNGDWNEAHFGSIIFPLGDQNNDGFADWAVVSSGSTNGDPLLDRFDLFHGGNPPSQTPYFTFRPRSLPDTAYMNARQTIGDFNGDDYIDFWIGYWEPGSDSIAIELYGGGPSADTIFEASFQMPYEPTRDYGQPLGDHNGDGYDDFYYYKRDDLDLTFIFLGNPIWDVNFDLTNRGEPIGSGNDLPTPGVFGDFNGDNFDDYLTGTPPPNELTFVYFGNSEPDTIPDIEWNGGFDFPATLSADMNNDGAADLAVGGSETIAIHFGGMNPSSVPSYVLSFPGCPEASVHYVYSAGDYNDDGYEDLIASSSSCANGFGKLSMYLGSPWLNPNPVLEIEGLSGVPFDDVPIWRALGIGDVNGDGVDDLAIGCQGTVLEGRRGRVVILSGDTTLIVPVEDEYPLIPTAINLSVYPNPGNGFVTIHFDIPIINSIADMTLYNLQGQRVDQQMFTTNSIRYDVASLASGIYIVQANAGTYTANQKLVVLK